MANVLSSSKIDKPTLHISPCKLCAQLVAHVQPLRSLCQQSFDVRLKNANKRSLRSDSGDHGVEGLTHPMAHRHGGQPLRHFALHFSRCISFLCAVRGDASEFVVGIGPGFSVEQILDQPLRDDIGKAPIGRGRVRVILHGKSEVSLLGIARTLQNIFRPVQSA